MRTLLAAAAVSLLAAAPPRPAVVRVDVSVADARGRLVDTLTAADFEVLENGVAQSLDAVRFVKVDPRTAAGEALPPIRSEFDEQEQAARESTRLFALFLDEYHVSAGSATTRVRETLARFVDSALSPRDLVVVLKPLDSLLTIRLTRDRELIHHAIETFQGRRGEFDARTPFEQRFIAGDPARIAQVRTQVAASALNALTVHLGRLTETRKTVVFVTEGLSRLARRRGLETLPTIDTVIRSANRYNVSIYPVDPGDPGDADGGNDGSTASTSEQDVLRTLAEATDGRAFLTPVGLDAALRQMVADTTAYYLLTYRSVHPADGKFRDVQVRVKRPGLAVRSRKGYWALWPDEALAREMLARSREPGAGAPTARVFDAPWHVSTIIRPWFGVSRGANGKTRVTFVWEPAPRVPGDSSRPPAPSRVELKVLAPDGQPGFEAAVAAGSAAAFEVPPGRLRLRMAIQDAAAQLLDTDVREIAIRDLNGPVALGTAEIVRTRNAREFRAADGDPDTAPVAAREFSRTERLLVRFHAYAPGGAPGVAARLLSRMGQTMRDLPIERPSGGTVYRCDLPLAGLAPGEYLLELSVSSPAGEAKDLVGFRVTS